MSSPRSHLLSSPVTSPRHVAGLHRRLGLLEQLAAKEMECAELRETHDSLRQVTHLAEERTIDGLNLQMILIIPIDYCY